jgi:hypothetical protein
MKNITHNRTAVAPATALLAAPVTIVLVAGETSVASVAVALLFGLAFVAVAAYFASALVLRGPRAHVTRRPALGGC